MIERREPTRYVIDRSALPAQFPTHKHQDGFWESLGRTVATFGFLEEALGKAIFSFTATREIPEDELQAAFEAWLPTLEKMLSDPLGGLIQSYEKAVRLNKAATIPNLADLIGDLKRASKIRNVLCHGSWRVSDKNGKSIPFFVSNKGEIFLTPIDVAYLDHVQEHVVDLICSVIDTVTHMGWQFPGSNGPGIPIFEPNERKQKAKPECL